MFTQSRTALLFAFITLTLTGCAHYPLNQAESPNSLPYTQQTLSHTNNADELTVILAFSGGGTRAAALSYGVMEELAHTPVTVNGHSHRLLDEVDLISSVSGGSFTAAYYCLHRERLFTEFEEKFLKHNIQNSLAFQYFKPRNWCRSPSTTFSSSDLAAEFYDRHLFHGATFADLAAQNQKPQLLINATDVSLGTRFTFSETHFKLISSDLSSIPISRAVAASSAFPGLLSPITLKNFSADADLHPPHTGHEQPPPPAGTVEATVHKHALDVYHNSTNRPYLHLVDGGVTDNVGLRTPLEPIIATRDSREELAKLGYGKTRKLVVIVVDSDANRDFGWQRSERTPNSFTVLLASGIIPVRRYSRETIELFRERITQWANTMSNSNSNGEPVQPIEVYFVHVGFDALVNESQRHFFKQLRTNYTLPADTVDDLTAIAADILRNSEDFQRLLQDLK